MKRKEKVIKLITIVTILFLLGLSLLIMYYARTIGPLFSNHFSKQLMWVILGIFLFALISYIPPKIIFKYSFWFYVINLFCLFAVLFVGVNTNGAKAWLKIKSFQFQPSETMKLAYGAYLASYCSNRRFYSLFDEFKFLLHILIIFLLPTILVFLEPDTGAILFYLLITLVLLWNTKISRKWFWVFFLIIAIIGGSFIYLYLMQRDYLISILGTSFFYRVDRVLNFGNGLQISNALTALGSAPLFKFNLSYTGIYIPEAPTDFIFALSSNVLGLCGPFLILICYLILDICLIKLYRLEKNETLKLFFQAFLTILIFSEIENIGMNLGILPIIGISLPFLSYGGSCMIVSMLFLGIIFSKRKSLTKKRKTLKILYR